MKLLSAENNLVQSPAVQLARLSGLHGYRFDGDTVHLNAMFALLDAAAHDRTWALQLWACYAAPASDTEIAGHIVAEVPLPPMGELADEIEHFEVSALAWPPPGPGDHAMVLVLASGRPGQYNDVHDFAVYPNRESFVQPRLLGSVGYSINGERVQISVENVENPRPAENISGTLSLELWALSAPYTGGRFQGAKLAGVEIGSVQGQSQLALQPIDLSFTPPPVGDWQIVLMLREWTVGGFVTRDFANFATRFVTAPEVQAVPAVEVEKTVAPAVEKAATPVIEKVVAPVVEKAVTPAIEKVVTPAVEKAAAPVIEKVAAPVAAATAVEKPAPPVIEKAVPPVMAKIVTPVIANTPPPVAAKAIAPEVAKAASVSPAKAPVETAALRVSVNHAKVEELAAVEGLNKKLAEVIVKKRPFSSIDELAKIKGLGAKVLAKVRASLKL